MYIPLTLFVFCLVVCDVQGKVELYNGQVERVSFDGDKLEIFIDNSANNNVDLQICFASSPDESYRSCPSGFTGGTVTMRGYSKRELTLNRQGQFLLGKASLGMWGTVKFNEDGTLNITAVDLPDPRTIVTLKNAEIFVPEKPKEEKVVTTKKSNASNIIIAVVVVLLLVGVVIGILVWFCIIRKLESKQIDECDDQDDTPKPHVRSSTLRNLSATTPAASNRTTVTIQTTMTPKHFPQSCSRVTAQSPTMAKT